MAQQRESETPISISGYQYYIQQTNQTMWCNLFDWFGSLQADRTLKKSNLVILCRSIKNWDLTFAGSDILWNMVICLSMIRVLVRVRRPFYACPQNTRTKCSCASEELFYAIYIFRLSGLWLRTFWTHLVLVDKWSVCKVVGDFPEISIW